MNYNCIGIVDVQYLARLLRMGSFYDMLLKKHFDAPSNLYVEGACSYLLNNGKTISVVGTRSLLLEHSKLAN